MTNQGSVKIVIEPGGDLLAFVPASRADFQHNPGRGRPSAALLDAPRGLNPGLNEVASDTAMAASALDLPGMDVLSTRGKVERVIDAPPRSGACRGGAPLPHGRT
ncbi:hypothetical protein [Thiocystis violacea]|uniref:hypothetical protein n=1 Tax=Thiocystis violacea TaxID=13725 RepID=UPI001904F0DD|nr:hypothetical protein [Thiocystis violacea]MBK1723234.1 hypothetical protein [Thiocystis violacea]